MRLCLDTSAWLEYFNAGPHGPYVQKLLQGHQSIFTPAVVAAQIVEAARVRDENSKTFIEFLQSHSEVVPVTAEIARIAGKINARRAPRNPNWSLIESLVLATAQERQAHLVTRDPLFGGVRGVDLLGPATGGV